MFLYSVSGNSLWGPCAGIILLYFGERMTVTRNENRHVKDLWCYVIFFVDGLEEWCLRYCEKSNFVWFLLYVTRFFRLTMSSSCSSASGKRFRIWCFRIRSVPLSDLERTTGITIEISWRWVIIFWICPRPYIFYLSQKLLNNRGQKHAIKRKKSGKKKLTSKSPLKKTHQSLGWQVGGRVSCDFSRRTVHVQCAH